MRNKDLIFEAKCNLNISLVYLPKTINEFKNFITADQTNLKLNGLEIVIGWPHLEEENCLIDTLIEHPLVNWKVIWLKKLSYAESLNICIQFAVKRTIVIVNYPDYINFSKLYEGYRLLQRYHSTFVVSEIQEGEASLKNCCFRIPHLLFIQRADIIRAGGAVDFSSPESVLINIVRKLQRFGLKAIYKHQELLSEISVPDKMFEKELRKILYPVKVGNIKMNQSLKEVMLYDWSAASFGEKRCREYLKTFKQSKVYDKACFEKKYKVIALIQTYNEIDNIPDVLHHLDNFCDGIIMLDDGSTDGSYEQAKSEKLLLKVQKARSYFDDLTNRNIMMDLVSFFSVDWIYVMDADERFDERYNKIYDLLSLPYNLLSFRYINLWNSETTYRADYETSPNKDGIFYRKRMFRNIGRAQIYPWDNRRLHFNPVPFIQDPHVVDILVLHYGTLSKEERKEKYNFYITEDFSSLNYKTIYKFLNESRVVLNEVKNIVL